MIRLSTETAERLRRAVFYLPGETIVSFVERAVIVALDDPELASKIDSMEKLSGNPDGTYKGANASTGRPWNRSGE